ncbi:MFS transporter [Curtobacterium sp. ODYSSEY 48 V2]|uniref:MFS transporter n=1 Tax=Curtobacterium sp. ODYSSEY 48 V2 TaxID=2939561 RepID=UPI002040F0CF|nr:MFS transporter [Curtobacterium sp. ODYSSEY 48 V2]MCM3506642.1 MFS transporter [Curtobacterium sp. ODYSSEY 48 V2]
MKRSFSLPTSVLLASGLGLVAATYGLVRLAFGLFLPDVQRDLGFGADVGGAVSSGASVLYCTGAVVGFLLADRAARELVVVAALTAGLGAITTAASATTVVFGVAAVVASTGAGLASPAMVQLVAGRLDGAARDRAQAVVNSGTGPGLVAAGVLALVLLPDWRTAWAAAGVVTLLVGAVVFLAAGRRAPDARSTPAAAQRSALQRPAVRRPALRAALPGRSWFGAQVVPVVVALLLGAGSAAVWTYGRSALVGAGVPSGLTVVAWIALGVGGASVAVTARWTSGLPAARLWLLTTTLAAVAVLTLGLLPHVVGAALVACALFGWGYTAATGALIAWTTEIDHVHAAAGTALLFVVLVAGQALGAAAAGVLVGPAGTATTFTAAAAVVAVAATTPLVVARRDLRPAVPTR